MNRQLFKMTAVNPSYDLNHFFYAYERFYEAAGFFLVRILKSLQQK
jgi:hypothetical protein